MTDQANETDVRDRDSDSETADGDTEARGPTDADVSTAPPEPTGDDASADLPDDVREEAERLTRLARHAVDENERAAYHERRDRLLAARDFTARLRQDDDTLVLHPAAWFDGETIRTDRIDDLDRAVEIPLSGPGDPDDWDALDAANRDLVAAVRDAHGSVHGDNVAAFADFMGNHYAKPVTDATAAEVAEFLTDYFRRNAWPSDEQRAVVERSLELLFAAADEPGPPLP